MNETKNLSMTPPFLTLCQKKEDIENLLIFPSLLNAALKRRCDS